MTTARQWVLELPPGTPFLTGNHREHWSARQRMSVTLHGVVKHLVVKHKVPRIEAARIRVEYLPPPRLRKDRHPLAGPRIEDNDALWPASKALVDGLVKAGVLIGDSRKRVESSTRLLPGTHPQGVLRIVITEVTDGNRS